MRLSVFGLLLLQATGVSTAGTMYGLLSYPDPGTSLVTLNPAAPGTITIIGATGVPDSPHPLTGLDFAPNGSLYASAFNGAGSSRQAATPPPTCRGTRSATACCSSAAPIPSEMRPCCTR